MKKELIYLSICFIIFTFLGIWLFYCTIKSSKSFNLKWHKHILCTISIMTLIMLQIKFYSLVFIYLILFYKEYKSYKITKNAFDILYQAWLYYGDKDWLKTLKKDWDLDLNRFNLKELKNLFEKEKLKEEKYGNN